GTQVENRHDGAAHVDDAADHLGRVRQRRGFRPGADLAHGHDVDAVFLVANREGDKLHGTARPGLLLAALFCGCHYLLHPLPAYLLGRYFELPVLIARPLRLILCNMLDSRNIEDEREAAVAEDVRRADAADRIEVLLQAFDHGLLLADDL